MGRAKKINPAYRLHKRSGQAVVTLSGQMFYLGKHGSNESHENYATRLAEWHARGRVAGAAAGTHTVAELLLAWRRHAEPHFKNSPASLTNFNVPIGLLRKMYGTLPTKEFDAMKLRAIRETLITQPCRNYRKSAGPTLSVGYINDLIERIRQIFAWGVPVKMVPADVIVELRGVKRLDPNRTFARATEPVGPVAEQHVYAIRDYVSYVVWAMVEVQYLAGMRSGEVCVMRGRDIDTTSGDVWVYRPHRHKTSYLGKSRVVMLPPACRDVLRPFLNRDPNAYLFSPRDAEQSLNQALRDIAGNGKPKAEPRERDGDGYTSHTYWHAIQKGIERAERAAHRAHPDVPATERIIPAWHPHQLRHSRATIYARQFGLETTRLLLGHGSLRITEGYVAPDLEGARAAVAMLPN